MIFIYAVKRSIYSNRTVTVKCCLTSLNFYAIAYSTFFGSWNVYVYNIGLAVAISTECKHVAY